MWTLLMIGIGVLIGWHFPQPEWAQKVQAGVTMWAKDKWEAWKSKP
jgi:hypothetical protein